MSRKGDDVVGREHDFDVPLASPNSATTSTAAAFSSTRNTSADVSSSSRLKRGAIRKIAGDTHDIGAVFGPEMLRDHLVRVGLRCAEVRDSPSANARHRSRPEDRRDNLDLGGDDRANRVVGQLATPIPPPPSSGRRVGRGGGGKHSDTRLRRRGSGVHPTTAIVRSAAIGGNAAPLPSKTTRSGPSAAATRAPSRTFDTKTAPARPPPHRRQPTVSTPASAAVSR